MRFRLIACEVLAREVYLCAARAPHTIDVELVEKGLHNTPETLRKELQERINATRPGRYDAILMGYGLCGNALLGLTARDVRVVIPRAHDCITLYLGSRERYSLQLSQNPGTYYYTADYLERSGPDGDNPAVALGAATLADRQALYEKYVAKYGRENADYLMEVMEAWAEHYSRAVYIDFEETAFLGYEKVAIEEAQRRGWTYEKVAGSLSLLCRLMSGVWPPEDFLVLEPGQKVGASYDERVIQAE